MSGRKSRNKGAVGERELRDQLKEHLGINYVRGDQRHGKEAADVIPDDEFEDIGLHFECKRTEQLSLYKAMEQAEEDCRSDQLPVVCHRRSRKPWLFICKLEDIKQIAENIHLYT